MSNQRLTSGATDWQPRIRTTGVSVFTITSNILPIHSRNWAGSTLHREREYTEVDKLCTWTSLEQRLLIALCRAVKFTVRGPLFPRRFARSKSLLVICDLPPTQLPHCPPLLRCFQFGRRQVCCILVAVCTNNPPQSPQSHTTPPLVIAFNYTRHWGYHPWSDLFLGL